MANNFPPPNNANLQNRADGIIEKARNEAGRIISQAEIQRQQAQEEGYKQGMDQGKTEWIEAVNQIYKKNEEQFLQLEPDLVRISFETATKLIELELQETPEIVVHIVSKALGAVRHQKEIYVRVHPEDYDQIIQHKNKLLDQLSRAHDIDIRPDNMIQRGGCLIESETGTIEATIQKQLKSIEKLLLGDSLGV